MKFSLSPWISHFYEVGVWYDSPTKSQEIRVIYTKLVACAPKTHLQLPCMASALTTDNETNVFKVVT